MNRDKEQTTPARAPVDCDNFTEAAIDEALDDSFPASDPPPWTLGTVSCPKPEDEPEDPPKTSTA